MNLLEYYFFKFNQLILFNKDDDSTVINTFVGMAFIFFCNILSIIYFFNFNIAIWKGIVILFSLIIILYFRFIHNYKYVEIINK